MKKLIKKSLIPLSLAIASSSVFADHQEENSALQDAWLDGKLGTVIVLNRHLNPLKIETDVVDGKAIVIGRVDSMIQKNLMTELALGIEGIEEVDNQLMVQSNSQHADSVDGDGAISTMLDASITAAISTKLLLNSEVNGSAIDVDTNEQRVTLNGTVAREIESALVEEIASNTFEVEEVINKLVVSN